MATCSALAKNLPLTLFPVLIFLKATQKPTMKQISQGSA
jgi:hypothetical protein